MLYGYVRVSTPDQEKNYSIQSQRELLMEKGVPPQNIRVETFTGETFDRPVLQQLTEELRPGDKLYVVHIDRLARNLPELIDYVHKLQKRDIQFIALNLPATEDTTMNWLFISVFACLAEYETNRRRERQAIGIAKAKQDPSKYRGRRSLITPQMKKEIREDLLMNRSIVRIAERLGVSRSTVYHALRQIAEEEKQAKQKAMA